MRSTRSSRLVGAVGRDARQAAWRPQRPASIWRSPRCRARPMNSCCRRPAAPTPTHSGGASPLPAQRAARAARCSRRCCAHGLARGADDDARRRAGSGPCERIAFTPPTLAWLRDGLVARGRHRRAAAGRGRRRPALATCARRPRCAPAADALAGGADRSAPPTPTAASAPRASSRRALLGRRGRARALVRRLAGAGEAPASRGLGRSKDCSACSPSAARQRDSARCHRAAPRCCYRRSSGSGDTFFPKRSGSTASLDGHGSRAAAATVRALPAPRCRPTIRRGCAGSCSQSSDVLERAARARQR